MEIINNRDKGNLAPTIAVITIWDTPKTDSKNPSPMKRIKKLLSWLRPAQTPADEFMPGIDIDYYYEELRKTVVILSLPADEQIKAMGVAGDIGMEMLIDYETGLDKCPALLEAGLLTPEQVVAFRSIQSAFPELEGEAWEDFYCWRERLYFAPYWDLIRSKAGEVRKVLGLDQLQLRVEIDRGDPDDRGLQFICTRTRLEPGSPRLDEDQQNDL